MPKAWVMQSNMNQGELDPRLVGRTDLAVYYNGLSKARNVTPLVQGGMARRGGFEYVATIATDSKLKRFSFSTSDEYVLSVETDLIRIFNGDTEAATIVPVDSIPADFDFVQTAEFGIIVQETIAPKLLVRVDENNWTLNDIVFQDIPEFNYNDSNSPASTPEIQTLAFGGLSPAMKDGDVFKLSLEGELTTEIAFTDTNEVLADNIEAALLDLILTPRSGIDVVGSGSHLMTITFSGDAAKDWKELVMLPVITSDPAVQGLTAAETQKGVAQNEPVWSALRGWPRTATFHEGRLWFGGSQSRPQTLWGSVVNDFFSFDKGKAFEDESIEATLDTDQVNAIQGIVSNRSLQIFTSGQEFFVRTSPVTPENIAVAPQTNYGSKRIRPVTIDGKTLYIQRTGKAVREFVQSSDVTSNYDSISASLLAPHLIRDPVEVVVSQGDGNTDDNYAYIVNSDGTIAVLNSLGIEEIKGFTLWDTAGGATGDLYKSSAVVNDALMVLVERTIAGGQVLQLERLNLEMVTDGGIQSVTTGGDTLTGLGHLEGETVSVLADGSFMGEFVVSGGQVVIDRPADTMEAGYAFTPIIETMPLNLPLQNGPNHAEPKRMIRAAIDLHESLGVLLEYSGLTERIADKTTGLNQFDNPKPLSGLRDMWLLGWDKVATLTITQDEPVPMTVLAISLEVGVQ
jgi:hypothetical protein